MAAREWSPLKTWRVAAALLAGAGGTTRVAGHESTLPHFLAGQIAAPVVAPATGPVAPLTIELTLAPANEPTAGLVRVTVVATGRRVDFPAHLRRPMGWFSLDARTPASGKPTASVSRCGASTIRPPAGSSVRTRICT
jgi:hypothetical protein